MLKAPPISFDFKNPWTAGILEFVAEPRIFLALGAKGNLFAALLRLVLRLDNELHCLPPC